MCALWTPAGLIFHCCSWATSRTVGTVGLPSRFSFFAVRSSLLHLSRRDLVSRFLSVSSSAATRVLRPSCIERSLKRAGELTSVRSTSKRSFHETLHRFPAGSSWKCIRRQHKMCQFLKVFGLAFIKAKRSNCTRAGWLDSNTRRNRNTGLYHLLNTHARTHRRIDKNVSTRARASLNWSRVTLNKNCRRDLFLQIWEMLRAFTLLTPPRLQPGLRLGLGFQYVLHIVFLASFALNSESQKSTFIIIGYGVRSTFHRRRFSKCLHQHLYTRCASSPSLSLATDARFDSISRSASRLRL